MTGHDGRRLLPASDDRPVRVLDARCKGNLTLRDGVAVGGREADLRVTVQPTDVWLKAQRVGCDFDPFGQSGMLALIER